MQFTENTIAQANALARIVDAKHGPEYLRHCLVQMQRFFTMLHEQGDLPLLRAVQLGLNMGRAQELLDSCGGMDAWWNFWTPYLKGPAKAAAAVAATIAALGYAPATAKELAY